MAFVEVTVCLSDTRLLRLLLLDTILFDVSAQDEELRRNVDPGGKTSCVHMFNSLQS